MSLYREAGRRRLWPVVAAAAAVLLVFGGGFLAGRASEQPSLEQALEPVRADTQEVQSALELVAIHYPEQGEPAAAELTAARDQAGRLREAFDDAEPDLALLAPDAAEEARRAVAVVVRRVEEGASADDVRDALAAAEEAVRALPTAR